MFYGTRLRYKLIYFITAMGPAYLLFILRIYAVFDRGIFINDPTYFSIGMNAVIVAIVLIILALILKKLLRKQYVNGLGKQVLDKDIRKFNRDNIIEINGTVVSFLLGNIMPVVFVIENSLWVSVFTFFMLQILIYELMINSSEMFPNVLLIIFGLDICKTKDGDYIFVFSGKNEEIEEVYQLGDSSKSKIYISSYKK